MHSSTFVSPTTGICLYCWHQILIFHVTAHQVFEDGCHHVPVPFFLFLMGLDFQISCYICPGCCDHKPYCSCFHTIFLNKIGCPTLCETNPTEHDFISAPPPWQRQQQHSRKVWHWAMSMVVPQYKGCKTPRSVLQGVSFWCARLISLPFTAILDIRTKHVLYPL